MCLCCYNCSEECVVLVKDGRIAWGFWGTAECVSIHPTGGFCIHVGIHRHMCTDVCIQYTAVHCLGARRENLRRQLSFDSLTFQFYPPAHPRSLPRQGSPLPLFLVRLSSPPFQSLFPTLLFSVGLEEQSQSRQSLHFVTLLRVGLSLTPRHVCWKIFFVHQSDLPVLLSPGGVAHYSTGAPNLYHCLSVAPSHHLYPHLFRVSSFCPLSLSVLLYLSLSLPLWHPLHLFLSHLLTTSHTLSSSFHSLLVLVFPLCGPFCLRWCWHIGAQLGARREHCVCVCSRFHYLACDVEWQHQCF